MTATAGVRHLQLLSRLWLHEPTADDIVRAEGVFGVAGASPGDLAIAYADLLLLNVFPYGSAFTDDAGELNGRSAKLASQLFNSIGFHPPELGELAGADHLGVCLACCDVQPLLSTPLLSTPLLSTPLLSKPQAAPGLLGEFHADFVSWAPVCCLALEREPNVHPFYMALAGRTREYVLSLASTSSYQMAGGGTAALSQAGATVPATGEGGELWLNDLLAYLLVPARSGVLLSRGRFGKMARELGLRIPFGPRHEVARSLFSAAGEGEGAGELAGNKVVLLLDMLKAEIELWGGEYSSWYSAQPAWHLVGAVWGERVTRTLALVAALRTQAAQNGKGND
jgi:hypothetical protein